ncbi:MAG: hypothetical protein HKN02_02145 [Rhodobacteraceae bacterium]|nr:hypothetical protein [Paracoccaceae bacterium]
MTEFMESDPSVQWKKMEDAPEEFEDDTLWVDGGGRVIWLQPYSRPELYASVDYVLSLIDLPDTPDPRLVAFQDYENDPEQLANCLSEANQLLAGSDIRAADSFIAAQFRAWTSDDVFSDPAVFRALTVVLGEALRQEVGLDATWSLRPLDLSDPFDDQTEAIGLTAGLDLPRDRFFEISDLLASQLFDPDLVPRNRVASTLLRLLVKKASSHP